MAGHDDSWKAGKFRAVVQWGFSSWQGIWGEYGVGWRKRHFAPVGMNESTQTRQWHCCCKVVLSVVGDKLMSFCPLNKEFLNTKTAWGIVWISSALGTYLSQWFINGVRKVLLPTILFQGLFLWGMSGTLVSLVSSGCSISGARSSYTHWVSTEGHQRGRKMSAFSKYFP